MKFTYDFKAILTDRVLYYDCTNYYFEIEEEDGSKRYGKVKEHRPNPIITMGLFMDADGIPLAFDMFPGNQNEQTTLKPLETKIIKDFNCSEFIFCSDAGLESKNNRFIDLRTLDETDETVFNTIYYKEIPVVTGNMDETLIVTYSPKYKAYQKRIRSKQLEQMMVKSPENMFTVWIRIALQKKPCMTVFMQ